MLDINTLIKMLEEDLYSADCNSYGAYIYNEHGRVAYTLEAPVFMYRLNYCLKEKFDDIVVTFGWGKELRQLHKAAKANHNRQKQREHVSRMAKYRQTSDKMRDQLLAHHKKQISELEK